MYCFLYLRAFGCVLYEMITLEKVFDGENDFKIKTKIMNFKSEKDLNLTANIYFKDKPNFINLVKK